MPDSGLVATRAELAAAGWRRGDIDRGIAAGTLIRARRNCYVDPALPGPAIEALRVGGVITCLSLLQLLGIFVFENSALHVRVPVTASRLRAPGSRRTALSSARRDVVVHWSDERYPSGGSRSRQSLVDALIHAVRCEEPRHAIATLDSALNSGAASVADINDVFAGLPARYRVLQPLVDGRSQSGPETLLRLLLRTIGARVEIQVSFRGIGRVDLLVDGWLVVEVDGRGNHEGWRATERDRRRDVALAAVGFTTLRPTASQVLYEPEAVLRAIRGLLAARRRLGG